MITKIPLGHDEFAYVDSADALAVLKYGEWYKNKCGYAVHYKMINKKRKVTYLHRFIASLMGLSSNKIDHKNRYKLDCRRENLRECTDSQNTMNKSAYSTSGYKGVYPNRNKWAAQITYDGVTYCLGTYAVIDEAAKAYDRKAKELFKEFAVLNFPD